MKASCSDTEAFICQVYPELYKRDCDDGFSLFGSKCYLYDSKLSTYSEAEQQCKNDFGSSMVMIKSESEQAALNSYLSSFLNLPLNFPGLWLGLSDHDSPGDMAWNDGDYVSYQNWAIGEPDVTTSIYPGGTCAAQAALDNDIWVTDRCGVRSRFGYGCEKLKGNQCPQGWSFFSSPAGAKCYQFVLNGASHRDWISSDHYCSSIGASLMEVNNKEEQFILSTHFKDWAMAGVSRLWLGVRCSVNYHTSEAMWLSHSTDMAPTYSQWGENEPAEDCDGKPVFTTYECEYEKNSRGPEFNEYWNAELKCPSGELIEIKTAFWGRSNRESCSADNDGSNEGSYNE